MIRRDDEGPMGVVKIRQRGLILWELREDINKYRVSRMCQVIRLVKVS